MSTDGFDSIEYWCEQAFGGGTHVRIDRVRGASGVFQFVEIPVAGGYQVDRPSRTRQLTEAEVKRLVVAIRAVRICVLPPYVLGFDGTTSTLKLVAGFNEITLRWWSNADGWEDLEKVVHAINAA